MATRAAAAQLLRVLLLVLGAAVRGEVGFRNCTAQFPGGGGGGATSFKPWAPHGTVELCKAGVLAIAWDPATKNPQYAAYRITPEDLQNTISGRLDFHEDKDLESLKLKQPATDCDAFNYTWNRGHLGPNHILSYSASAKHATFTMANVAPQYYYWNQHVWMYTEMDIYDWVKGDLLTEAAPTQRDGVAATQQQQQSGIARDPTTGRRVRRAAANSSSSTVVAGAVGGRALYIMTGVAYKDRREPSLSWDGVAVPAYFWKVLCEPVSGQAVGLYGTNKAYSEGTEVYRPVADVEALYGGPLLPPDGPCNRTAVDPDFWRFFP